ncbi:MAG: c-type cytochrome, partial [Chthoniobacteraceae bacterium]
ASVDKLDGDAARGRQLIAANCAICHQVQGVGNEVGPDLAMTASKPVDWLLTAIFDPNAAVEPRYQAEVITTADGVEWNGIVATETANSLTLRLPGGAEHAILRGDISARKPTGKSLMPEGLESVLTPQAVADIIAVLRQP